MLQHIIKQIVSFKIREVNTVYARQQKAKLNAARQQNDSDQEH